MATVAAAVWHDGCRFESQAVACRCCDFACCDLPWVDVYWVIVKTDVDFPGLQNGSTCRDPAEWNLIVFCRGEHCQGLTCKTWCVW